MAPLGEPGLRGRAREPRAPACLGREVRGRGGDAQRERGPSEVH
eukprot:CAMPEP_0174941846 /NCGR_PEP_ID=MMETSP1355-20121228/72816_1 /TAXON_ID=464990 /ORGANISM="Hemiselmis tepida, Strain CCMP443" /LENGTH=43 /DNA_ID= /DNA_START= /DNA_END= /DNA_ORIENTATION=